MKKSILFYVFLISLSLTLTAQDYSQEDFVGTWKNHKNTIKLDSDKYAKITWSDGDYSYGKWHISSSFGTYLNIKLNNNLRFKVQKKTSNSMTLYDEKTKDYFTFTKESPRESSFSIDEGVATAVILGAGLLWLWSNSDSGEVDDYTPCSICGGKGYIISSSCPSGCSCSCGG